MATYLRLFDPTQQFQLKNGALNVSGRLYVYLEGTDDYAALYDENGSQLSQPVVLDNNGRSPGLFVDSKKTYWLKVNDQYDETLFTIKKMTPCGGGGGSVLSGVYDVVSTDGSIYVDKSVDAGNTTFDLSIGPDNARELLEWTKAGVDNIADGNVYPLFVEGTMNVFANEGVEVFADRYYHVTSTFTVKPTGHGINYETLTVYLMLDVGEDLPVGLCRHDFDVDNSVNDSVELEFAYDLIDSRNGKLYWAVDGADAFSKVDANIQIHRVFSGINAVPGTVATTAWVEQNLSSKISYSALEYNSQNLITGISGSAIASNAVDPNEFIPWSASGTFQPSGDYLTATASSLFQPSGEYVYESAFSSYSSVIDNSITAISSVVSSVSSTYIEKTASGMFQPSGDYVSSTDMSAYVPFSGLEHDGSGRITAISGSGVKGHEYTGVDPVWVDNSADQIGVYRKTLAVDETMTAYETGDSAVIGVNTAILSGYAKASSLEDYQLKSAMTAYASVEYVDSGMSGKLDVTASSLFLTSLPADLATTGDVASAVSGKLDNSASGEWYPKTGNPSGFLTAHQSLAGYATEQYVDSSVSGKLDTTAYNSAQFILTSQSGMFQPSGYYQPSGEYLSATESSNYYSTSNPSGFITGVDLTPYQLTADMSAYQPSGDYQTAGDYLSSTDSAEFLLTSQSGLFQPSGDYLSATESSNYYPSSNPSGFITGVDLTPYQLTADMSGYYTTANESGFVDSAYVEGQVSSKQDASAMTAYQEVSGMTAYQPAGDYQPSGDYIYVSALGWAEV